MNKLVPMVEYYNLRLGYCDNSSESDFIDNINTKLILHVAKGYDMEQNQFLFTFQNEKFLCKKETSLFDNLDLIVQNFSRLEPQFSEISKGLILSLYKKDHYGINEFSPKYAGGYFEANETDEVSYFSPCFFGVGSVTYDCLSEINSSTGEILHQGENIDNMEDFYGCVDEDETWVIGCVV